MIAGELSGDKLGASLIEGLRYETDQKIIFSGIGGPLMEAAGLKSLFNISDLSLMGLAEIIPKIPMLLSNATYNLNTYL